MAAESIWNFIYGGEQKACLTGSRFPDIDEEGEH